MDYVIQGCTDIGNVKQTNQDSFSIKIINTPIGKVVFAIMCDGMGGLAKGEVASASVVKAYDRWVEEKLITITKDVLTDDYIASEWTRLLQEYNEKIKMYSKSYGANMGTTTTAMLITENRYYIVNVGDTRAYEITQDTCTVMTRDQTVVAREIERGLLTEEQAEKDPRRSVLLQCIGASESVYPEFFYGDVKKDTVYMLCTDGFRHEITPEEIHFYLKPENMTEEMQMRRNIRTLIDLDMQRQERDNISVVAVKVQ